MIFCRIGGSSFALDWGEYRKLLVCLLNHKEGALFRSPLIHLAGEAIAFHPHPSHKSLAWETAKFGNTKGAGNCLLLFVFDSFPKRFSEALSPT